MVALQRGARRETAKLGVSVSHLERPSVTTVRRLHHMPGGAVTSGAERAGDAQAAWSILESNSAVRAPLWFYALGSHTAHDSCA